MSISINQIEPVLPTAENLDSLFRHRGNRCLSIYLPIHVEPPASEQNPIRLRNLLAKAREILDSNDVPAAETDELFAPFDQMIENPETLLANAETLAFFVSDDTATSVTLPFRVSATIHVADRFLIKPLVKLRQENPTYTALCLARGEVRVLRGTRTHIERISVPGMPEEIEDVTRLDDPEKSLQHHASDTTTVKGGPGSALFAQFHGQGLPSDYERSQIERFLREVGKSLDAHLSGDSDPLLIFGVEQNLGLLKALHEIDNRIVLEKQQDPQNWTDEDVRKEAWKLLQPECEKMLVEKLNLLEAARSQDETIDDVSEAALAASTGRLNLVAVAVDTEKPGTCDAESGKVEQSESPGAGDLLDLIASETITHGGEAIVVESGSLPEGSAVLASKRF